MNQLTQHFFDAPDSVFTHADVAAALKGSDDHRYGLVKRALAKGEIQSIRRGLYCLARRYQKKPVSVYALSQRIYGPSYVSLESALCHHGWIPEAVYGCTCASYGKAKNFDTPLGLFSYQRIPQEVFYTGVERLVDSNGNVSLMATPAKALADYVYVHRPTWSTIEGASGSLRIEMEDLLAVNAEDVTELAENYRNSRVARFIAHWREVLKA